MENQQELFDENDYQIKISNAKYLSYEKAFCEDVFSGFDELRVVTYSYGLKFIEHIIKNFSLAEVIVGNENLINRQLAEIFISQKENFDFAKYIFTQSNVRNYLKENEYLIDRVKDGSFKVFVPEDLVSHQKLYLLKSRDGRYRTILGSGNFSFSAWKNVQLEDFIIFDEKEAYDHYAQEFETLREMSTDEITVSAIEAKSDENALEELPVFKKIQAKEAVVIKSGTEAQADTIFKTNNLNEQIVDTLKKVKLVSKKQGAAVVEAKSVKAFFTELKTAKQKAKEQSDIYPQLVLDFENRTASFNGQQFDLSPAEEDVKKNINAILEFFNLLDSCAEDGEESGLEVKSLKNCYWKIFNYMFLSPFLAHFRILVHESGFDETNYPIYLLFTGYSGIGKTNFVQFVQKLMLNSIPKKFVAKEIKKEQFDGLKLWAKGAPLLVDEMDNFRWGKLKGMVKADDFLMEKNCVNHPCFIMPSNDITFLDSDIQRRCLFFKIYTRLDISKTRYKSRMVSLLKESATNALYRLYVKKMFEYLDEISKEIRTKSPKENWIPDIFKGSARILHEIFAEADIQIPEEFKIFDINDYIGNSEKLETGKQILVETYKTNPEIFNPSKRQNILQIDFTSYNYDYKNRKNINILEQDLPHYFKCVRNGMKLTMKLSEFTKLTGIKPKRRLFRH